MTTIARNQRPWDLVASIERGLDRMLTSQTQRVREMRQELERQESVQRHHVEVKSREYRETLEMAARYLRSRPNA